MLVSCLHRSCDGCEVRLTFMRIPGGLAALTQEYNRRRTELSESVYIHRITYYMELLLIPVFASVINKVSELERDADEHT